jgi:TatA/E family protein of Tat protein translocase
MGPLGWQETVAIFVLALLIFGPKKLPQLGKDLAKMMGEFRRASSDLKDTWHREMAAVERETQEIQDEANKIVAPYSDSTYNYDGSYDYGGYGYSESSDGTSDTTTASATAIEGAAKEATESTAVADASPAAPEGTVPTSTTADAAAEAHPSPAAPAEPAASR